MQRAELEREDDLRDPSHQRGDADPRHEQDDAAPVVPAAQNPSKDLDDADDELQPPTPISSLVAIETMMSKKPLKMKKKLITAASAGTSRRDG